MVRILAIGAALAVSACASTFQRIEPHEFEPHGRFPAAASKEQAFLECRLQAESAGRQAQASGAPGTLPQLTGIPPGVLRAVTSTFEVCMQSRGFRWMSPR